MQRLGERQKRVERRAPRGFNPKKMNQQFRYYLHDGPDAIGFELSGHLSEGAARELEQARRTASSTASGRSLIVDLSYVTGADAAGLAMLRGWYADGAQLIAKSLPGRTVLESITHQTLTREMETARRRTWRPVFLLFLFAVWSLLAPARALCVGSRPRVSGQRLFRHSTRRTRPSTEGKLFDSRNAAVPGRQALAGP